jgi:hypothetical protein
MRSSRRRDRRSRAAAGHGGRLLVVDFAPHEREELRAATPMPAGLCRRCGDRLDERRGLEARSSSISKAANSPSPSGPANAAEAR